MKEFKFFQKDKHAAHVAVLTARYETFVNWKVINFPGTPYSTFTFSSNGTTYYMVNSMNRIAGYIFDTYIELHDSHQINNYVDVIGNLNQRRLL
jgi:hypothetical protein